MKIQNLLAFQIDVDPSNKRIELIHDVIRNHKINAIYLYGSQAGAVISSPIQDKAISTYGAEDLFLNITDIDNVEVIKNLSLSLTHTALSQSNKDYNLYSIDKIIDVYKSYISFPRTTALVTRTLLLLIAYQTGNMEMLTEETEGTETIIIEPTAVYEDICLHDYIGELLVGKKIKRIIVEESSEPLLSYLDIQDLTGKRIENIPCSMLSVSGQKVIQFDNLLIDPYKSFFKQRGAFTLNPRITFIY